MKTKYEASDSIIGAHILVGLTYLNEEKEQIQLHGHITSMSKSTIEFKRADGNGLFSIPFEGELEEADFEAIYTLNSTGEKVTNVNFISSWTISPPEKT